MKPIYKKPEVLKNVNFHFCPGCQHGLAHKIIAEAIDSFQIKNRCIAVIGVGCGVFLYDYFDVDSLEAPHGRGLAVATGVKRARPERIVFTYQGDGDLASIGLAETVHAANRGENVSVFFINNTVYGMTGGQMAPTTLLGQVTTTSPYGREFQREGYPIRMAEMLSTLEGVAFSARIALCTPKQVMEAKKVVKKAFQIQLDGLGFSFVELLSACPTNWNMQPLEAIKRVEEEMIPFFPLGIFKERSVSDVL
jgi:2-oxoglutarate ferredoxin oxidoreductase subunit beta